MKFFKVTDNLNIPYNAKEMIIRAETEEEALSIAKDFLTKFNDDGCPLTTPYTGDLSIETLPLNGIPEIVLFTTV